MFLIMPPFARRVFLAPNYLYGQTDKKEGILGKEHFPQEAVSSPFCNAQTGAEDRGRKARGESVEQDSFAGPDAFARY